MLHDVMRFSGSIKSSQNSGQGQHSDIGKRHKFHNLDRPLPIQRHSTIEIDVYTTKKKGQWIKWQFTLKI